MESDITNITAPEDTTDEQQEATPADEYIHTLGAPGRSAQRFQNRIYAAIVDHEGNPFHVYYAEADLRSLKATVSEGTLAGTSMGNRAERDSHEPRAILHTNGGVGAIPLSHISQTRRGALELLAGRLYNTGIDLLDLSEDITAGGYDDPTCDGPKEVAEDKESGPQSFEGVPLRSGGSPEEEG